MNTTRPNEQLTTLDFLPIRIGEGYAFLSGELSDAEYPKWVQTLGGELARQLLPSVWFESAGENRSAFLEGHSVGMILSGDFGQIAAGIPKEDLAHAQRVLNTGLVSANVSKVLKAMGQTRARRETRRTVGAALEKPALKRLWFFRGLVWGLDMEGSLTNAIESLGKHVEREKAALRLHMWLRWPEFEELNSIPEAYARARKAFERIQRAHVVGSEAAFRRYCNRIGLTYLDKQRAKRAGQNAAKICPGTNQ